MHGPRETYLRDLEENVYLDKEGEVLSRPPALVQAKEPTIRLPNDTRLLRAGPQWDVWGWLSQPPGSEELGRPRPDPEAGEEGRPEPRERY